MNAFDRAWLVVKAPYDVYHYNEGKSGTYEGPLYSGGDIDDDPMYWTGDFEEAMQYALFGSAIPNANHRVDMRQGKVGRVPMRQTRPRIMVAEDPGYDEDGNPAGALTMDPVMTYRNVFIDPYNEVSGEPMEDEALLDMLEDAQVQDFLSGPLADAHTSADHYNESERLNHIFEAIERLKNRGSTPPPPSLPEQFKDLVETSASDPLHLIFGEDYDDDF